MLKRASPKIKWDGVSIREWANNLYRFIDSATRRWPARNLGSVLISGAKGFHRKEIRKGRKGKLNRNQDATGILREPMRLIQWTEVASLAAFYVFLAPVQLLPAVRKVPPERLARSCGMTSGLSVRAASGFAERARRPRHGKTAKAPVVIRGFADTENAVRQWILLDRAADVGEDVAGVGADEAHGADYDDEDDREHDGILGYVLTLFVVPEIG